MFDDEFEKFERALYRCLVSSLLNKGCYATALKAIKPMYDTVKNMDEQYMHKKAAVVGKEILSFYQKNRPLLPCTAGDKIYFPEKMKGKLIERTIVEVRILKDETLFIDECGNQYRQIDFDRGNVYNNEASAELRWLIVYNHDEYERRFDELVKKVRKLR